MPLAALPWILGAGAVGTGVAIGSKVGEGVSAAIKISAVGALLYTIYRFG